MRLRVRLIVAFFLLSVVPLTVVTFYAYASSARALREAVEREADLLAGELGQRMQLVTAQLSERVEHVMDIAELQDAVEQVSLQADERQLVVPSAAPAAAVVTTTLNEQVAQSLGEAAMLLNNVRLRGLRGSGRRSSPPGAGGTDASARSGAPATPPVPPERSPAPAGPDAGLPDALRIDLAPIRRELLREMVPDGRFDALTPEQRRKLGDELRIRMLGIQQGLQLGARALQQRAEDAQRQAVEAAASAAAAPPAVPGAPPPPPAPAPAVRLVRTSEVSGTRLDVRVERDGEVVRELNAEINLPNLLATVFSTTRSDRGEVPFAFGADGQLFTPDPDDRAVVESFGNAVRTSAPAVVRLRDWIVVTTSDPSGFGLTLGIARPMGDSLAGLRRTAAANAGLGMLLIGLALAGIVPLSSRLTRNLSVLHEGVARIARGDYRARVSVKASDEIGDLADAFNKMAEDVERHQRAAIGQERLKRELELGRQIQNDMLPHSPLRLGSTEIKGVSVPAREVGGDFFNYFELPSGQVALLVGDVSGKGVGAALLMANIQASLRTRLAMGQDLAVLADALDHEVEAGSPAPVYATLFVAILDPPSRVLRYVNAGHNPQYVLRADRRLDRMHSTGLPIGLLAGHGYREERIQLDAGDVLFFYTDGCVEAEAEADDEMFGAERLEQVLSGADPSGAEDVLARVESAVNRFRGSRDLFDDATMMAVRVG
jgi:serine phosphatase RsbU (regulator of sigma subunit)